MAKQKWTKIQKDKEETLYKGFKLVIANIGTPRRYDYNKFNWCWHGYVYDANDKIIPTAFKQSGRYKLHMSVVQSRDTLMKLIDDNWYYYSGEKAKDDNIKEKEEALLAKRRYVMQNIHSYAEFFPDSLEIDAATMWPIVKFALDNFDECEELFKAKTQLADVLIEHYREQDKWLSLPDNRRQREVFSHVEKDTVSRLVHDVSSYWGYDNKYWVQEPTTRNVYTNNPYFVNEPAYPFEKTRKQESIIHKLNERLYQSANKVDFGNKIIDNLLK